MNDDRRSFASDESADDTAARERALDIGTSFLVQAPAGSGKTELLIQRFLALLATVDRPERIVAITFTRKAAGEMRERIIAALRDARANESVDGAHAARTRDLARAALEQDRQRGWQLEAHPARLALFTIDALAASLVRQAPIATAMGSAPRYREWAAPLYAEAARAALARARADDPAWRRLMAHLDNDANRAIQVLGAMLAKRDQWLHFLGADDRGAFRALLEATLVAEIEGETKIAAGLFPREIRALLANEERYAAANLGSDPETAELARHLAASAEAGGIPQAKVEALPTWRSLADWLLVADKARFRVSMRGRNGFPPIQGSSGADRALRQQHQAAIHAHFAVLTAVPGLAQALHAVRRLPPPEYSEGAWELIDALDAILPRAAAELALVFRDAGAVDFTQGALAAVDALGSDDAPSDLLLKLDLRMYHLLIDEFQDTSFTQLDLVRRLTAGWQQGDGRTLFAVGDPMQSIYRFRGAEVRLFVEAQQAERIGDVPVETLVLRRNFRSQRSLVDWVNRVFPEVMGPRSDPWRGTVAFTPATATRDSIGSAAATIDIHTTLGAEAESVAHYLASALAADAGDLAVLVRARSHLDAILPALRAAEIAFDAVELDPLARRQAMQDLSSLTHALLQPADRLAWFSLLRAPWCGLLLADVFAVAAATDAGGDRSLAALMHAPETVAGLTPDGQSRLRRIANVMAPALEARGRAGLAARVRGAWLALGGGATIEDPLDLDAAERYFALLGEHEDAGDIADWQAFQDALTQLHAAPESREAARVQVMTLHRAKGLEFDTVAMPGLALVPQGDSPEILRWRRRPGGLLLAPMAATGGVEEPVYAYLDLLNAEESSAELARLLYVGATRAKRRLHLSGVLRIETKGNAPPRWSAPPSASALAKFWPLVEDELPPPSIVGAPAPPPSARLLARLPLDWNAPLPAADMAFDAAPPVPYDDVAFDWVRETARHVGTVAHRLFADIAREGLPAWDERRIAALAPRLRVELGALGVDDAELAKAVDTVTAIVSRLLDDPRGRWLFDPSHADAASEWALAGIEGNAIAHIVIDRTFVAEGVRWIVEFKTGAHEGAGGEAFLDAEEERYRTQLERYARFVRAFDPRPIRLGIHHPLQGGWREWPFDA